MRHHDFTVIAWSEGRQGVAVMAHATPAGSMRGPVRVPVKAGVLQDIRVASQESWLDIGAGRAAAAGAALGALLFPEPVLALFRHSLDAVSPDDGVRLRLCLDESLVDLPWELALPPDAVASGADTGYLLRNPRMSLVREPRLASEFLRSAGESPTGPERMLFAGTPLYDAAGVDLWRALEEFNMLAAALEPCKDLLRIEHTSIPGNFMDMALKRPASVFHYSGHAGVSAQGQGCLVQSIPAAGSTPSRGRRMAADDQPVWIACDTLAPRLAAARVRLVTLNACDSSQWPVVAPLLAAGVPAVVGVHGNVTVDASFLFFARLYSHLALGFSLDEAVSQARLHLMGAAEGVSRAPYDWAQYAVYMPTGDPVLVGASASPESLAGRRVAALDVAQQVVKRVQARDFLARHFNLNELRELCFELGAEDAFSGDRAPDAARDAVTYFDRRGALDRLIDAARGKRPTQLW